MKALYLAALLTGLPKVLIAQNVADSTPPTDSARSIRSLWARSTDASGLVINTTKTYNRVEGLGIYFGPVYRDSSEHLLVGLSVAGIIRSANGFHWDAGNLGHDAALSLRFGPARRFGAAAESYDIVEAIERWQLADPEAGLAAFLFHRDYRDWFGRHGGAISGSLFIGLRSLISVKLRDERWITRDARDVFSVNRNGEAWRPNPRVDDGRARLLDFRIRVDTRNDERRPSSGWFTNAELEHGRARFDAGSGVNTYGRVLIDARRYTRLSPGEQLNARLVAGGKLYGDDLPLQRRLSVGGVGTIPGFDFRRSTDGTDVAQCSKGVILPGSPAMCEHVVLAQLEYRSQIAPGAFERARPRIGRFQLSTLRPTAVAFVDAGRGWPATGRFMTDVGLGIDIGIAGVYVAKAVSSASEPANFFVRIRNRF